MTRATSDSARRGRRAILSAVAGAVAGIAGCVGGGNGGGDETADGATDPTGSSSPADTPTEGTRTDGPTATDDATTDRSPASGTGDDLDLREANVTAVAFEADDGDAYRFSVTLYHDDGGEEGYANWWQVETTGGRRLGRRKLLHAHGTREFTRSERIDVPPDVRTVVVRGHDQTHGYGGRAALVDMETASVEFVDRGSEKQSFADRG